MSELRLITMSDVETQAVRWLWHPYIPYGKITIIQGDPERILFLPSLQGSPRARLCPTSAQCHLSA